MSNVSGIIKSIQDIMRKDVGVDGDAQRISQMVWMFFLKIFDDREEELELLEKNYKSPLPEHMRWRVWAKDPEGITGDELADFVKNVYLIDVAAVGAFYPEWTTIGKGVTNYLSVPDLPLDTKGTKFELPGGYIPGGDLSKFQPITSYKDAFFRDGVKEAVKHSWYEYSGANAALPGVRGAIAAAMASTAAWIVVNAYGHELPSITPDML